MRVEINLENKTVTSSKNSRNVILHYKNSLYYVSCVNVHFVEGRDLCQAIFHARRVIGGAAEDIELPISQRVYKLLVEYTQLDNPDLLLVLLINDDSIDWGLISEKWLKYFLNLIDKPEYIV